MSDKCKCRYPNNAHTKGCKFRKNVADGLTDGIEDAAYASRTSRSSSGGSSSGGGGGDLGCDLFLIATIATIAAGASLLRRRKH